MSVWDREHSHWMEHCECKTFAYFIPHFNAFDTKDEEKKNRKFRKFKCARDLFSVVDPTFLFLLVCWFSFCFSTYFVCLKIEKICFSSIKWILYEYKKEIAFYVRSIFRLFCLLLIHLLLVIFNLKPIQVQTVYLSTYRIRITYFVVAVIAASAGCCCCCCSSSSPLTKIIFFFSMCVCVRQYFTYLSNLIYPQWVKFLVPDLTVPNEMAKERVKPSIRWIWRRSKTFSGTANI